MIKKVEFTKLLKMLRTIVECGNIRSEKLAKLLHKLGCSFKIWVYNDLVYALFNIDSLLMLSKLSQKLKRIRHVEHRFLRIENVGILEGLYGQGRSEEHSS